VTGPTEQRHRTRRTKLPFFKNKLTFLISFFLLSLKTSLDFPRASRFGLDLSLKETGSKQNSTTLSSI